MSQYIKTPPPGMPGQIPGMPPQQLPVPKKGMGLFKKLLIGGVIGLVALVIIGAIFGGDGKVEGAGKVITPDATLAIAEANILTNNNGVAYSNSEEGLELAKAFAAAFKEFALEATTNLKSSHDFITHCQLHDDSAVFIVHVPKLRKFEKESKEEFCVAAWGLANGLLLGSGNLPPGAEVAIAVKGNVLYQNMYFGKLTMPTEAKPTAGVEAKEKNEGRLKKFFKGPPATPEVTEPAKP